MMTILGDAIWWRHQYDIMFGILEVLLQHN